MYPSKSVSDEGRTKKGSGRKFPAAPFLLKITVFRASAHSALDEFHLVTIGIFEESDHRGAMLHGPRRPRDRHPFGRKAFTETIDVAHAERHMPIAIAEAVGFLATPVMGQFDDRRLALVAITHEGQSKFATRI